MNLSVSASDVSEHVPLSYADLSGGRRVLLKEGGKLGVERHKMYSRHVKLRNISSGTDVSDVNIHFPNSSLIPS